MKEVNGKFKFKDEQLEKVSGGYEKRNIGYELVVGDCFKQGAHAILRVKKYYDNVDSNDMIKCQKYGQQAGGSYYYIMDLDVKFSTLIKGEYLGYEVL